MKKKISKRGLAQFAICCFGGNIGYGVYMLRNTFYDAFLTGFGINNEQFATLVSIYASVAMFTYFLGGIMCDKMSARGLVALSMVVNGVCTIYLGTYPSYGVLKVVYAIMGLCATFTFWAPLQKVTRQMGRNVGGEGKAFGGVEGGRAFAEMIIGSICVAVGANIATATKGLTFSLTLCGGVLTVCGVAAWFAFKEDDVEDEESGEKYSWKILLECLKNPCIWVQAFAVLGAYAVTSSLGGYTSKMATVGFGATAATASLIGMFNSYTKPIGAIGGGFVADKIGRSKTMIVGAAGMGLGALAVVLLPKNSGSLVMFTIIYAIIIIFVGIVRGSYYSPLSEGGVPMTYMGTAVGIVATVGYLPDVFLSRILGRILDSYEGVDALNRIMYILAGCAAFCILMCLLFQYIAKKQAKKEVAA